MMASPPHTALLATILHAFLSLKVLAAGDPLGWWLIVLNQRGNKNLVPNCLNF